MKPKDKEKLVRARPAMVRSLDVVLIMPALLEENLFTQKEADVILSDSRRRERVVKFLDVLEKKKTEVYMKFQDILGDYYPQLLLSLTDWEEAGDEPLPCHAELNDDSSMLQRARSYLIHEIDAAQIMPHMRKHEALTAADEHTIMAEQEVKTRTEVFLDILELRPPQDYETFVEALGDIYPHVYLAMTGQVGDSDGDDW